jgi:GNAT superfamily N-acetyltransferase
MALLIRTNSDNKDFIELVKALDAYLAIIDGDDHAFYHQFNKTNALNHVVVVYENEIPVGCGAIKPYGQHAMEVKRMYVDPQKRGKGIARQILNELEKWAIELSCSKCVLETGKKQADAVRLYTKSGYSIIPNYGQYANMETSVCFEKELK